MMSPIRKAPPATAAPAITVIAACPRLRISDWAPFSMLSEVLARTATST